MQVGDRVRLIGLDGTAREYRRGGQGAYRDGPRHGPGALDGPDPPDEAARGGVP